jgi:tetratricopeptide (TPR) repeat protein
MNDKLPLKNSISLKKLWPTIRNILIAVVIIALFAFIASLPNTTSIDFAIMRRSLSNYGIRQRNVDETTKGEMSSKAMTASEAKKLEQQEKERKRYINESRARMFVESATNDYYKGSYDEALRRLDRAGIYDPCNFSAFKLRGQIFFEHNLYRKAFNNLERANQLPNDDKTIARDLDVLRKLLRYSRNEIDQLRQTVNENPDNKVAKARLKELEERIQD